MSRGWLMFGLASFALVWIFWQIGWQPAHVFNATRFILYDQGSYLYAVERLNQGEVLYRDLNWQYGPLAAGWYWLWAQAGGNSPLVQVLASAGLMAAAWGLLADLTLEAVGKRTGMLWALAGLLPVMSPSGINAMNGPHGALEMFLLAAMAWVLAKCPARNRRACLLGLLVGLLQWVRFGPHAIALLALVVLEGGLLRREGLAGRDWLRQLAGWLGRVLLVYAILAVPLAAYYRSVLPWAGVFEQLWPSHMTAHYAATYTQRWPEWPGWPGLMTTWLPVLGGLTGMVAWLWAVTKPRSAATAPLPAALTGLAFGPLYWVIGGVFLFRNDYAMMGHLWLVWPGLAVGWNLASPKLRISFLALVLPALADHGLGVSRAWQEEIAWRAEPQTMPNGQRLWFRPNEARRFAELGEALGGNLPEKKLAVFIAGGGVHYFYGTQRVGRHWWYLPEFVRPWEATAVEQALGQHEWLFVADLGQNSGQITPAGIIKLWIPLPDDMGLRLLPRLTAPRSIEGLGYVMRIQPAAEGGTAR